MKVTFYGKEDKETGTYEKLVIETANIVEVTEGDNEVWITVNHANAGKTVIEFVHEGE